MPEWGTYLLVFVAGAVVGAALRGRPSDEPRTPRLPSPPLPQDVDARVRALLREGKKIEAIKVYREATGVGLKEAKENVETLQEQTGS